MKLILILLLAIYSTSCSQQPSCKPCGETWETVIQMWAINKGPSEYPYNTGTRGDSITWTETYGLEIFLSDIGNVVNHGQHKHDWVWDETNRKAICRICFMEIFSDDIDSSGALKEYALIKLKARR